jgi:hypothetical protein
LRFDVGPDVGSNAKRAKVFPVPKTSSGQSPQTEDRKFKVTIMLKKRLSALLGTAALAAFASVPMQASAFSVDVDNNTLRTDDSGDALVFPFYSTSTNLNTTLNAVTGARSSFSVTNTSETEAIAVKIRFREQMYSQEIFDFIVFLSPRDKFDFAVRQAADANGDPTEAPRLYFQRARDADGNMIPGESETSCIAPSRCTTTTSTRPVRPTALIRPQSLT